MSLSPSSSFGEPPAFLLPQSAIPNDRSSSQMQPQPGLKTNVAHVALARFTENSAQTTPVDESPYSPAGALDGRITSENGQTPFIPLSCSDLLFAGSKRSFETNPASTHKKPKSNSPYGAPRLNGSHIDAPLGYKQHVNQSGIFGNHGDGQVGIDLEELFGCEEAVVPPHEDDVFIVGSNNRDPYSFEEIEFWEAVCALVLPK